MADSTQKNKNYEDDDPVETLEWLDSLNAVLASSGVERAQYLLRVLDQAAQNKGIASLEPKSGCSLMNLLLSLAACSASPLFDALRICTSTQLHPAAVEELIESVRRLCRLVGINALERAGPKEFWKAR